MSSNLRAWLIAGAIALVLVAPNFVAEGAGLKPQWTLLHLDLTHGDVVLNFSLVAVCPASVCVLALGSLSPLKSTRSMAQASTSGLYLEAESGNVSHQWVLDPPTGGPLQMSGFGHRVLSQAEWGPWYKLIVLSSGDLDVHQLAVNPPGALIAYETGRPTHLRFPGDFEARAHVFSSFLGVGAGAGYRTPAVTTKGLLAVFDPVQAPFGWSHDSAVHPPDGPASTCRGSMEYGVTQCRRVWVIDGPPGRWSFEMEGRAGANFVSDDRPVLLWADGGGART